jgi:crotonobetainyl-CoA:carnitine CoA-transferase CaiB-like acyl-CoA transferase
VNGDDTRTWGPPFLKDGNGAGTGDAGYFVAANRGKRSITLRLDVPEGQALARRLAARSDIVLENFRVGTLARYGLDYPALSALNPALIYCSITGFGQTGPKSTYPAYDFLIQAMGGMMSITGERDDSPGGGPQKVGIPIVDLMTGVYSATAVIAALAGRAATGRGEYIDMSMLDVQVGLLANQAMNFLVGGRTPRRTGNLHPNIQPQKVFACKDGDIVLVVGNDAQFKKLCDVLKLPHLAHDERYATNAGRVQHQDELLPQLDRAFASETRAHWVERLGEVGVPCGPINSIPEVFDDPQVRAREMLRYLPHAGGGLAPQVASPFRFLNAPVEYSRAPPVLGQHTFDVLREIGVADDEFAQLRERGII